MKKLLILSPAFPPLNTPDLQRVRMSLPYYEENGWKPLVLCVTPEAAGQPYDESLLATLPPGLQVEHAGALPLRLCRLLGVGNLGLRSAASLFWKGLRLIRREKPDLVFISTAQFALFPLARLWTALTGVPCVGDLHDPWVTDAYDQPGAPPPPGGWKYHFASAGARLLEGWSMRGFAGLISVSELYLEQLRERHPWFDCVPTDTIGFGASEADLAAAPPPSPGGADHLVHVVYTGAAGPSLNRILPEFLGGLALLRARNPAAAARLRIHFVGTSYVPPGRGRPLVLPFAERAGVADLVAEVPHRLGHLECLARQRDADLLLLLGSVDAAYSPSKLYPYVLSGRPLVAVVRQGGVLEDLLQRLHCGRIVSVNPAAPEGSAAPAVADVLADAAEGLTVENVNWRNQDLFRSDYLARSLVRRQCALFAEALDHHNKHFTGTTA